MAKRKRKKRNPLDTSGIVCDFSGSHGVTDFYTCIPFMLGGIQRSQFMACPSCAQLIANHDINKLAENAVATFPSKMRKQGLAHFKGLYTTFFANLLDSRKITPDLIFQLHIVRATAKRAKCEVKAPNCLTVASLQANAPGGWKNACISCVAATIGVSAPKDVVGHPDVRPLYPRHDEEY